MNEDTAAIILAGGKSKRMGQNKSMIPWRGMPLIAWILKQIECRFSNIYISTNSPDEYTFLHRKRIQDLEPGYGPMMGIYSVMMKTNHEAYFVCAVDIPTIPLPLIDSLLEASQNKSGACPVTSGNRLEPLFAIYKRILLPVMQELLIEGPVAMYKLINHTNIVKVDCPDITLENLNTPESYQSVYKRFQL